MPAPSDNQNAFKTGLRARVGKLPKGAKYISWEVARLRAAVESELATIHGDAPPPATVAYLQSALRCEQAVHLCYLWLRRATEKAAAAGDEVKLEDRLALLDRIAKFTAARDVALQKIGLPTTPAGPRFGGLFDSAFPPDQAEPTSQADQPDQSPQPPAGDPTA